MPPKKSAKPAAPPGPTVAEVEEAFKAKLSEATSNLKAEQDRIAFEKRRQALLEKDVLLYGDQAAAHLHNQRMEESQALQDALERFAHLQASTRLRDRLEAEVTASDAQVMTLYDDIDNAKLDIERKKTSLEAEERAAVYDESLTEEQKLRKQGHAMYRQLEFLKSQLLLLRTQEIHVESASNEIDQRLKFSEAWSANRGFGQRVRYPPLTRPSNNSNHVAGAASPFGGDPTRLNTVLSSLPQCDYFHQEHAFFAHAEGVKELLNGQPLYPYYPYTAPRQRVAILISPSAADLSRLGEAITGPGKPFLTPPSTLKLLRDELIQSFGFRVEHVLLGRSTAAASLDKVSLSLSNTKDNRTDALENGCGDSGYGSKLLSEEERQQRQHLREVQILPHSPALAKSSTNAAARRLGGGITFSSATSEGNYDDDAGLDSALSYLALPCASHFRFESRSKLWLVDYLRRTLASCGSSRGIEASLVLMKGFHVDESSPGHPLVAFFPEDAEGSPSLRAVVTPSAIINTITTSQDPHLQRALLLLDVDGVGGHRGFQLAVGGGNSCFCWKKEEASAAGELAACLLSYLQAVKYSKQAEGDSEDRKSVV